MIVLVGTINYKGFLLTSIGVSHALEIGAGSSCQFRNLHFETRTKYSSQVRLNNIATRQSDLERIVLFFIFADLFQARYFQCDFSFYLLNLQGGYFMLIFDLPSIGFSENKLCLRMIFYQYHVWI